MGFLWVDGLRGTIAVAPAASLGGGSAISFVDVVGGAYGAGVACEALVDFFEGLSNFMFTPFRGALSTICGRIISAGNSSDVTLAGGSKI